MHQIAARGEPKILNNCVVRKNLLRLFGYDWQFHGTQLSRKVRRAYQALAIHERRATFAPTLWEKQKGAGDRVLEQVWFRGVLDQVGFQIDFVPIQTLEFGTSQAGECADRNIRHNIGRRVFKKARSFINGENADRSFDRFCFGGFLGGIVYAVACFGMSIPQRSSRR